MNDPEVMAHVANIDNLVARIQAGEQFTMAEAADELGVSIAEFVYCWSRYISPRLSDSARLGAIH
jgi:hypothetical protein